MRKFTNKELYELEELSFNNLVVFYAEELTQMSNGIKVKLTKHTNRSLRRHGVLNCWRLPTPRALQVLGLFK